MAYSSGDLILDDHYNGFASDVNTVWGTGSGDSGYGQSNTVSSVSAGSNVTATQWATLLSRITSAANHQGSSITSITSPSAGDTISAYTVMSGNITTITNNRLNYAANGTDLTSNATQTRSTGWFTDCVYTYTFNFSTSEKARHFFNAGGQIRISYARSGGTTNNKNTEWTDLCNRAGTLVIGGNSTSKSGGSGTVNSIASSTGWQNMGASYAQMFKQFADTSPYTGNYIKVEAYKSAANVVVRVTYMDAAGDTYGDETWANSYNVTSYDRVDGNTSCTALLRPPSTTYISNSWGTPSISGSVAGGIYDY